MKRSRGMRRVLCVVLLLGLIAALILTGQRMRIEAHNHSVAAVMSWSDLTALAAASGDTEEDWLATLAGHGLAAVVLESENGAFDEAAAAKIRGAGLALTLSPDGPSDGL